MPLGFRFGRPGPTLEPRDLLAQTPPQGHDLAVDDRERTQHRAYWAGSFVYRRIAHMRRINTTISAFMLAKRR